LGCRFADFSGLNRAILFGLYLLGEFRSFGTSILIAVVTFFACLVALFSSAIFIGFRLAGSQDVSSLGNNFDRRGDNFTHYGGNAALQKQKRCSRDNHTHGLLPTLIMTSQLGLKQ
jgi:hypothetical protein